MSQLSRRRFVGHGLQGCALCVAGSLAAARVPPSSMTPVISPGYEAADVDERGLWQAVARLEEQIATSNFLIGDSALKDYVRGIIARLLGDFAGDLRLYIVRDPEFNASMAPNGMMIVHTGLLARMRDEAQLAAVLGHESGHYLRRHTLRRWRDLKAKTAAMAVLGVGGAAATGATGANWYDLAYAINTGLLLSLFSFSREMESEADAFGLKLMGDARYSLAAAASVWSQVIDERKASAAARKKRYRDRANSALSTHPPTTERMSDLKASANELQQRAAGDGAGEERKAEWLAAIGPFRSMLLEEQVRLNDPGASQYLLNSLAQDGWNGVLRYYEGEMYRLRDDAGDAALASAAYAAAVEFPDAPPEAYRAHGYALLKAGNAEQGRQALARYLELRPDAPDASMVRFTMAQ